MRSCTGREPALQAAGWPGSAQVGLWGCTGLYGDYRLEAAVYGDKQARKGQLWSCPGVDSVTAAPMQWDVAAQRNSSWMSHGNVS